MRHVTDWTVMAAAWRRVRASQGANTPGADNIAARDLPSDPPAARVLLQDLAGQLHAGEYTPGPVRRFEIAKPNHPGKTRPIAILNLTDRVVHMALKLVLEPIVEASLGERCYGFRPGRGRYDQLQDVRRLMVSHPDKYAAALSTDIASCFDQLDHRLILDDVSRLVLDQDLVSLFRALLDQVGSGMTGWVRHRRIGVLQGSALSPLIANWNLSRFDRAWRHSHGDLAPLYRYADDLLLLARNEKEAARLRRPLEQCLWRSNRLELAVEKTRVGSLDRGIPLLGLMVRRHHDPFGGRDDIRVFLDPEPFRDVFAEVDRWVEQLDPDRPLGPQFARFNQRLRGWFESYQYAYDSAQAFESLDRHLFVSLRRRLKEMLGCSVAALQQRHHRRLPSGHDTWQADHVSVMSLSALPRKCYRPKLPRSPWESAHVQVQAGPTGRPVAEQAPAVEQTASDGLESDPVLTAIIREARAEAPKKASDAKPSALVDSSPSSNGRSHANAEVEGTSDAAS